MADWYLAPSLVALRTEINRRWPNRDKASDGALGDASHQARVSDHNPDWSAGGVVRAIDVDKDGIDVQAVLDATIGDQRIHYVIWDRHIWSVTYGWVKQAYDGADPHTGHVHISIQHTKAAETDTSRWLTEEDDMPYTPEQIRAMVQAELEEYGSRITTAPTGTLTKFMADVRAALKTMADDIATLKAKP